MLPLLGQLWPGSLAFLRRTRQNQRTLEQKRSVAGARLASQVFSFPSPLRYTCEVLERGFAVFFQIKLW